MTNMYKLIEKETREQVPNVATQNLTTIKEIAKNYKKDTKKESYILSDGIKIWDTETGDNVNIFYL